MISHQEWDQYTERQKLDYVFDHSSRTERDVERLSAAIDDLRQRVERLESPPPRMAS